MCTSYVLLLGTCLYDTVPLCCVFRSTIWVFIFFFLYPQLVVTFDTTWTSSTLRYRNHLSPFCRLQVRHIGSRKNNLYFSYHKRCLDRRNKFDDLLDLFHPLRFEGKIFFLPNHSHHAPNCSEGHTATRLQVGSLINLKKKN